MSFDLSMLSGVTLKEVKAPEKNGSSGARVIKEPALGAQLRVFKNGRVYPAMDFALSFGLEHQAKEQIVDPITGEVTVKVLGAGMDVFSSKNWTMVEGLAKEVIFCAITPRQGNGKIDLFGSTQYNEDGKPKKLLYEIGKSTFGHEQLVPMLENAYGVNFEETPFVDLLVHTDHPMISPNDVYVLPKVTSRGENKGKASFARRENINVFPLSVAPVAEVTDPIADDKGDIFEGDTQKVPDQQVIDELQKKAHTPNQPEDIEQTQEEAQSPGNVNNAEVEGNIVDSLL